VSRNGAVDHHPSKRARITTQYPTPLIDERDDVSQLWWGAVQSDDLLANGLPGIPFGSSSSISHQKKIKLKRKRPKRPRPEPLHNPKSLLSMMNHNLKTMRRIRHTHTKFVALNVLTAVPEDDDGIESNSYGNLGSAVPGGRLSGTSALPGLQGTLNVDDDMIDDKIDERPWTLGRSKGKRIPSGIDIGEEKAMDCLDWAAEKILEHIGFQGTSKVARDVLSGVTAEYLSNVGRTIRFLTDKFGKTMTPEVGSYSILSASVTILL
jgi:transcriptional activator SPT7